jgi:dethiobiotin synthetase
MQQPFFITGIGTDVGKTLAAAILTEALKANYWKPIQAGYADGTDAQTVRSLVSHPGSVIYPELYKLATPASPHIAAAKEGITISPERISQTAKQYQEQSGQQSLLIEGAGGLLVPLTGNWLVADMIRLLNAKLILVSRNYLGSINHSLLTAAYCRTHHLDVAGWVFSDDYLHYEEEIVALSGYPLLASIPHMPVINRETVRLTAERITPGLHTALNNHHA